MSLLLLGDTTPSVMEGLATALQGILTTDKFFANLTTLVPVIGGVLIFAFTYRIVRRIVKGAQKGRANI